VCSPLAGCRSVKGAATAVIAVLLVPAAAGCGSSSTSSPTEGGSASTVSANDGPVNIAFLGYSANNAYTASAFKAAQEAAARNGAKVTFFDSEFDGAAQLAQVRDVIASGRYQGMIVMPNNSQQMGPGVENALAKGIKVATIDYPVGQTPANAKTPGVEGVNVQLATDVVNGAKLSIDGAIAACKAAEPCEAAIIVGSKANQFDVLSYEEYKRVLAETPYVKIVSEAEGAWLPDQSQKVARDVLQANPDLDMFLTTNDQACVGAELAATEAGKEFSVTPGDGKIVCIGQGSSTQGVKAIREGRWLSSTVMLPKTAATTAVDQLVKVIKEPSTPQFIKTYAELSPVGEPVTRESLEKADEQFGGEWTA
jgi:ribose transport system substrate-binding protein